jgi:hypothetical protein
MDPVASLGSDAANADDARLLDVGRSIVQQRGEPEADISSQHDSASPALSCAVEQFRECRPLPAAAKQLHRKHSVWGRPPRT